MLATLFALKLCYQELYTTYTTLLTSHTIDRFSTRLNRKCTRFYSFNPELGALQMPLHGIVRRQNVFPPFAITPRVLRKNGKKNADGILISPVLPHSPKAFEITGEATGSVTKIHLFLLYFPIKENNHS